MSQWEPRIEIYRRLPAGSWEYFNVQEGTAQWSSGATLDLAALYADLPI